MLENDFVVDLVQSKAGYLQTNKEIVEIWQGNLLEYIDRDMRAQFSEQMYEQARLRTLPLNILPKIVDKLANLYANGVIREVNNGTESDKALLNWYEEKLRVNSRLTLANEFYALTKASLIYVYLRDGMPSLRIIPNDRFIVHSEDKNAPEEPTHIIVIAGKHNGKNIYWVFSKDEFNIVNESGETQRDLLNELNNDNGINPLGRLPFIYINGSRTELCPPPEIDTLRLTKLIPIMLTDLNVAALFQAFSIYYGIDIDDGNLVYGPNVFWRLYTDENTGRTPSIGTLKPDVDFAEVLNLIQSQLSLWMGTKGIRSAVVGSLTTDNYASGVSKLIDEMDTLEARQKQIPYFMEAERQLWDLVLHFQHKQWSLNPNYPVKALFTPTASVVTSFASQLPMVSRGEVVKDLREEFDAGFISRQRAIKKLNPEMTNDELKNLIKEIDEENRKTTAVTEGEEDGGEMDEDIS